MTKERYQNPSSGDLVNLRLFSYNSNNLADFKSIAKVEIYFLDETLMSDTNPDGRRLIDTFTGNVVQAVDTGTYLLQVDLAVEKYIIGKYLDIWTVTAVDNQPNSTVVNVFQVYSALWYTTPIPIVYDFRFHFQPNKFRQGSRQYIRVEVNPNVPTAGDLRRYYENLAIVSDLKVSIKQNCGDCVPAEEDLRLIVDKQLVDYREKRVGFYQLDTCEMACGIYDIWFQLEFGGNIYIGDREHFQIYN